MCVHMYVCAYVCVCICTLYIDVDVCSYPCLYVYERERVSERERDTQNKYCAVHARAIERVKLRLHKVHMYVRM